MERVFEGSVLDMQPMEDGVVFVYCAEKSDTAMTVAFKMLSFETGKITNVTKNVYLLSKFGTRYKSYETQALNFVKSKILHLGQDRVFILDTSGAAKLIDSDASILWASQISYKDSVPSDIAVHRDNLWAAFGKENALIRFNLANMREELRIGGGANSPFKNPTQLIIDGDTALVCNHDEGKIISLDLKTYNVLDYRQFPEKLHSYLKIDRHEFVILDSGLYLSL